MNGVIEIKRRVSKVVDWKIRCEPSFKTAWCHKKVN